MKVENDSFEYDPLLIRQLRTAMSSAAMTEILRRDWTYLKQEGLTLKDCHVVRVHPRQEMGFVIEYEMHIFDNKGERIEHYFGELVGSEVEKLHIELLEKLKKSRRKQISRERPIERITCFPKRGLILRVRGLDERLDGLRHIRKPHKLGPILSPYLFPAGENVEKCTIDILGHRLGKRCVIRYQLEALDPKTGRMVSRSFIGKVYKTRGGRGRQVFSEMEGLWAHGFAGGSDDGIRISKPLAYLSELQLLLMEDVPGLSLAGLEGSEVEPAIKATGRALAKLHQCALDVPARHTVEDELGILKRWVGFISEVHPELETDLKDVLGLVQGALNRCRNAKPTLVHRDFYEKQVLVCGSQIILIDFDTLCYSDPAIDIGNFLAHIRLAALQGLGRAERLGEVFLGGYHHRPTRDFSLRVKTYTQSTLLRLACLYSLYPRWSHLTKSLLKGCI